jgi:hypothetical protein
VEEFSQLVLLVLGAALFLQVLRGTARQWLRVKFLGAA